MASQVGKASKQQSRPQADASTEATARPMQTTTRDHLVAVGLDLMRRHGYGATGLKEILEAAQVPKGSFYHHFGSKESFTDAVIQRYLELEAEHCRQVLGNARQAPLRRLRRYFEELITMAGQTAEIQGCLLGKVGLEVAASSAPLLTRISAGFKGWQSAVETVLREARDKGELRRQAKIEPLAGFVINSWEGALLRSLADRSDAPLHDFMRYIFEELLPA